jgi:hypothetical protein
MQQVLVNLMRNAIEAMETMPSRKLQLNVAQRSDRFIEISLADSGPGLRPDIQARLFQPFVTTKSGGMGVGLSISRGIIERHGGRLGPSPIRKAAQYSASRYSALRCRRCPARYRFCLTLRHTSKSNKRTLRKWLSCIRTGIIARTRLRHWPNHDTSVNRS